MKGNKWEKTYRSKTLCDNPWHSVQPGHRLVGLVVEGKIKPDSIHKGSTAGGKRFLYACFMEKKG